MLAAALGLLFLATAALPDGNAHVRGLVARQKRREEALNRYTYDVEQLFEELDAHDSSLRLSAILEGYDFRTVAREDLDGWPEDIKTPSQ